jgi:hypothetical protein
MTHQKIEIPCRGCETTKEEAYVELRQDAYGYSTGYYCDDCYENNYPYRKDRYHDESYAGERLEDDY